MEDFERRTQASFGNLTGSDNEGTQWMPTSSPIYRNENRDFSSDDEEEERRRRTSVGGVHMDLGEDEFDTALGVRPSIQFSSQIDREEETDIMDIRSLQFDDAEGTSPAVPCRGDVLGDKRPIRSALKQKSASGDDVSRKKVSFTGIPEPKKAYVPPHKREGHECVPDYVKNPDRYTMYEFDEPVIVGGGVHQFEKKKNGEESPTSRDGEARASGVLERPIYIPKGTDVKESKITSEPKKHMMSFDMND